MNLLFFNFLDKFLKPPELYLFIHCSKVAFGIQCFLAILTLPPTSPDKYSFTSFTLNSFVYFVIQKPLHPYSGFWGSGQDYVDLYLIHWPVAGKYKESWKALEEIYASGRAKAIGVSNFHQHHLEDLLTEANVVPMVDQIELHPTLTQEPLRKYLAENKIAVEAWSPLGQGNLLSEPVLVKIGEKYGKSAAQVIIRWHLQNDIIVIPKSVHEKRIQENFAVFDFELTPEEITAINQLNKDHRFGADPDNFDF